MRNSPLIFLIMMQKKRHDSYVKILMSVLAINIVTVSYYSYWLQRQLSSVIFVSYRLKYLKYYSGNVTNTHIPKGVYFERQQSNIYH